MVKRDQDIAAYIQPLGHREPQRPWHKGHWLFDLQVKLVVAGFIGDLQTVAKPLGGDQRGLCSLAFDQSVGGQRGAVDEDVDIARAKAGLRQNDVDPGHDAAFRMVRIRWP